MRNLVRYQTSEKLFRKKKQYVPPMLPSRLPKSDANLNRCFTSTKCKKILNKKIIYRVGRILTIKLLATKKTFERFSIVFHVFPIKMSLTLSPQPIKSKVACPLRISDFLFLSQFLPSSSLKCFIIIAMSLIALQLG